MNKLRALLEKKEIDPEIKKDLKLEKNDFLAMVIAAVIVFSPVIIIAFAVVAVIILLFFH